MCEDVVLRCVKVCSVGGPMDIDIPSERVKGKEYRCKDCGEGFRGVGKKPICPSCQSDNVAEA